jgi:hypothetical protein
MISAIVTLGYGSFGSPSLITTLGYVGGVEEVVVFISRGPKTTGTQAIQSNGDEAVLLVGVRHVQSVV